MMNQSAQGLASLGRGNDSMLVHMTPREVQGLQGLAMAHGGSLTINPQTGLPEAGFLDAVLPVAAGFALGPGGFGLFEGANAALMAGLTVGGLTALASGDIGKGLMAGFGAYGGSGLGEAVKGFGAQAATPGAVPTGEVMKGAISANQMNVLNPTGAPGVNVFSGAGAPGVKLAGATQPYSGITGSTGQLGANLSATTPRAAIDTAGLNAVNTDVLNRSNFGNLDYSLGTNVAAPQTLGQGFSNVLDNPMGFAKEYGPGKLALQGGSLALNAMEPEIPEPYVDPDKDKYRGPQGQLNLSDRFDTGLRLAEGGTINTGGIRDLYGSSDDQLDSNLSRDGYGLGRLNNLANQQSLAQAQTTGYAEGGDVVAGERGMNLDELPSLNVNTGISSLGGMGGKDFNTELYRMNSFMDDYYRLPLSLRGGMAGYVNHSTRNSKYLPGPFFSHAFAEHAGIDPDVYNKKIMSGKIPGYAEGGDVNPNELSLNLNTGERTYVGGSSDLNIPQYRPEVIQMAKLFGMNPSTMARPGSGGILDMLNNATWTRHAKGGYLDGAGDGMSDSIPATIEGKQPARLADGEFVVPADVVSHLGNGSSKAGSKRLYAMLDKVRHARTGTKKQGKEIKPEKYMPA